MSFNIVCKHLSALHHELYSLKFRDVGERISLNCNQICELSRFPGPHSILPAHKIRCVGSGCPYGLYRSHTELHHVFKFLILGAVSKRTNSRAECDLYSLCNRPAETRLRDFGDAVSTELLRVLVAIKLVMVQRRHEINTLFDHQLDDVVVQ